jgi:hypothetical protein
MQIEDGCFAVLHQYMGMLPTKKLATDLARDLE